MNDKLITQACGYCYHPHRPYTKKDVSVRSAEWGNKLKTTNLWATAMNAITQKVSSYERLQVQNRSV